MWLYSRTRGDSFSVRGVVREEDGCLKHFFLVSDVAQQEKLVVLPSQAGQRYV